MRLKQDIMKRSGQNTPPKPDKACYVCEANDWWLRDNGIGKEEQLCGKCHPQPINRGNKGIGGKPYLPPPPNQNLG